MKKATVEQALGRFFVVFLTRLTFAALGLPRGAKAKEDDK